MLHLVTPDVAALILEYVPYTVTRLRLAQTCRSFALGCRATVVWQVLCLESVGITISRSKRKVMPSQDFFMDALGPFLAQPRFRAVKHLNASGCQIADPLAFFRDFVAPNLPLIQSVDCTGCEPDFKWGFLRWKTLPPPFILVMLKLSELNVIFYDRIMWVVSDDRATVTKVNTTELKMPSTQPLLR